MSQPQERKTSTRVRGRGLRGSAAQIAEQNERRTGRSSRRRSYTTRSQGQGNGAARRRRLAVNQRQSVHSGRVNRRGASGRSRPNQVLTMQEGIEIIHNYLAECERNLLQCEAQRRQLQGMVRQLLRPMAHPSATPMAMSQEDLQHAEAANCPANQYVPTEEPAVDLFNVEPPVDAPLAQEQLESPCELPTLLTIVRFLAEERGEQPQDTLNQLLRRVSTSNPGSDELALLESSPADAIAVLNSGATLHFVPLESDSLRQTVDEIYSLLVTINGEPLDGSTDDHLRE